MAIPIDNRFDVYLDTSAINRLYDYVSCELQEDPLRWARAFRDQYSVLISAVNIAEICATSDAERRIALLRLCYELLPGGKTPEEKYLPADFAGELLRRAARAYNCKEKGFCISLKKGRLGLWRVLMQPDLVDEQARQECRNHNEDEKKWYQELHANGRKRFEELRKAGVLQEPVTEEDFMKDTMYPSLQEALLGESISNELGLPCSPTNLVRELLVWRVFYISQMYEIYNRAIKRGGHGQKSSPHGPDVQQTIYLCFVKTFFTTDKPFFRHLRAVTRYSGSNTRVYGLWCTWQRNGAKCRKG